MMQCKLPGANCAECPARNGVLVPPEKHRGATWALVGERPAKNEAEQGVPFVGQSGRVVNQSLNQAGINRQKAVVLNAVNCYEEGHLTGAEYKQAVECCRPAVKKIVGDLPVVALGEKALTSFTGKRMIMRWIGAPLDNVFPVFHPAACFRKPSLFPIFSAMMRRAGVWLRGHYRPHEWPPIYTDPDFEALEALDRIAKADLIGVDVETAGEPMFADLLCVGVASEKEAVSLAWPMPEAHLAALKKVLHSPGLNLFHNAQHDRIALKRVGLDTVEWGSFSRTFGDTLVLHAAHAPQVPHSLSFVAVCELNVDRWKSAFHDESEFKGLEAFTHSSMTDLKQYNARDSAVEPPLWQQLKSRTTDAQGNLYHDLMNLSSIATEMRERGVLVSWDAYCRHFIAKTDEMEQLAEKFTEVSHGAQLGKTGMHGSLKPFFFDTLGAPVLRTTETGQPSLDSWTLSQLQRYPNIREPAKILFAFRKAAKLKTTYLDGLPVLPDGRVHPAWSAWRVVTGRWACGDPNMMNVPKSLRDIFIPTPGHSFVAADWQKVELWIVGVLSGDELLLQAFKDGVDVHTQNASDLFNIPIDKVTKKLRGDGKVFVYGLNYGASAETLWEAAVTEFPDLKLNAVVLLKKKWFEAHPKIKEWQRRSVLQAEETGAVAVPLPGGRRIVFHDRTEPGLATKAINHPVQGIVGWMANRAIQEVRYLNPVLQVHDELVLEAPSDRVETYARALKEAMEMPVNLCGQDWVFPVDLSCGQNWHPDSMESFQCD